MTTRDAADPHGAVAHSLSRALDGHPSCATS
jgi:hypothetical protein